MQRFTCTQLDASGGGFVYGVFSLCRLHAAEAAVQFAEVAAIGQRFTLGGTQRQAVQVLVQGGLLGGFHWAVTVLGGS